MDVPALSNEQVADMLPDQLRTYLATLDQAYTLAAAEMSEAIGEELAAKSKMLRLKIELQSLRTRIGMAQSVLKSMPVI